VKGTPFSITGIMESCLTATPLIWPLNSGPKKSSVSHFLIKRAPLICPDFLRPAGDRINKVPMYMKGATLLSKSGILFIFHFSKNDGSVGQWKMKHFMRLA